MKVWPITSLTRTGEPAGDEKVPRSRSSYREAMFAFITTVILYVFGFVFLYGVIRLGMRHAMEDLEARRAKLAQAEQMAWAQDRTFIRDNSFLAGG
jgi:hypothetical protein